MIRMHSWKRTILRPWRSPSFRCIGISRRRQTTATTDASTKTARPPIVDKFLTELEKDPSLFGTVWDTASKDARQSMLQPLVQRLSMRGQREFARADQNGDGVLTAGEFEHWLTNTLKRSSQQVLKATSLSSSSGSTTPVTRDQLQKLAVVSAIPFVGFGFLDNALMICTGSQIEYTFSSFGLSAMAAAALGNTLSDVAGIQAGGMIEALAAKMGLPDPMLTLEQIKSPLVKRVTVLSSAVGITIGCLLGMLPLLFLPETPTAGSKGEHDERSANNEQKEIQ